MWIQHDTSKKERNLGSPQKNTSFIDHQHHHSNYEIIRNAQPAMLNKQKNTSRLLTQLLHPLGMNHLYEKSSVARYGSKIKTQEDQILLHS